MDKLESLPVAGIRAYRTWTDVPIGRLVWAEPVGPEPTIGLRTRYEDAPVRTEALLILSGEHPGMLITADPEHTSPCLDVTDYFQLVVVEPKAVIVSTMTALQRGMLFQHENQRVILVWASVPSAGAGWVCLASSDPAWSVGQFERTLDRGELIGIGGRIDVERRMPDLSVSRSLSA